MAILTAVRSNSKGRRRTEIVILYSGFILLYAWIWLLCGLYKSKECKEARIELARVTLKGQITIPREIRKKLKLKEGDKVFFVEDNGSVQFLNASQVAILTVQHGMSGKADKGGITTEDDVVQYIKQLRKDVSL